jgi:hypothetical protein
MQRVKSSDGSDSKYLRLQVVNRVGKAGSGFYTSQKLMCMQISCDSCKNADSDLMRLKWGLRFCISSKIPVDANNGGP